MGRFLASQATPLRAMGISGSDGKNTAPGPTGVRRSRLKMEWLTARVGVARSLPKTLRRRSQGTFRLIQSAKLVRPAWIKSSISDRFTSRVGELRLRLNLCPHCEMTLHALQDKGADLCQFPGDEPRQTSLRCYLCERRFDVERTQCSNENCKGDVIWTEDDLCLTCGHSQNGLAFDS